MPPSKCRFRAFAPLLSQDRLCQIHAALGPELLPVSCRHYPRIDRTIDGLEETTLSLSCPEAARLVLQAERLYPPDTEPGKEAVWDDSTDDARSAIRYFWAIRELTVRVALRRDYALWKRLFLLGLFCRRLDAVSRGELKRPIPELLREFAAALGAGALNGAIESIRPAAALQLEMVLRLVGMGTGLFELNPRLAECVRSFAEAIGWRQGLPGADHVKRYEAARRTFYAPFFARQPQILENYLLNQMFRHLFPFGGAAGGAEELPAFEQVFVTLATQLVLTKGLLIGAAGLHGEQFSIHHVVQVVQSVSRHFEHGSYFLADAAALLRERKLDNAQGMALLLRN